VISWVKLGTLSCNTPYGNRGMGIHPTVFHDFRNSYMTIKEILLYFPNFKAYNIVDFLLSHSVIPITGTKVNYNKGYLFLREDILKLTQKLFDPTK
jgi:hypothetical protein